KVTGDTLVKARGKEFLKFNYEFSALFTQQGWNEYVRSAIKSKSELLAEKYIKLKINRTAQQVEAELREKHLERYARAWDAFKKVVRGLDAGVRLAESKNQEGLRRLLYPLIDQTRQALAAEAQKEANDTWALKVHTLYKDVVIGRYPFDDQAAAGAPINGLT